MGYSSSDTRSEKLENVCFHFFFNLPLSPFKSNSIKFLIRDEFTFYLSLTIINLLKEVLNYLILSVGEILCQKYLNAIQLQDLSTLQRISFTFKNSIFLKFMS